MSVVHAKFGAERDEASMHDSLKGMALASGLTPEQAAEFADALNEFMCANLRSLAAAARCRFGFRFDPELSPQVRAQFEAQVGPAFQSYADRYQNAAIAAVAAALNAGLLAGAGYRLV